MPNQNFGLESRFKVKKPRKNFKVEKRNNKYIRNSTTKNVNSISVLDFVAIVMPNVYILGW